MVGAPWHPQDQYNGASAPRSWLHSVPIHTFTEYGNVRRKEGTTYGVLCTVGHHRLWGIADNVGVAQAMQECC